VDGEPLRLHVVPQCLPATLQIGDTTEGQIGLSSLPGAVGGSSTGERARRSFPTPQISVHGRVLRPTVLSGTDLKPAHTHHQDRCPQIVRKPCRTSVDAPGRSRMVKLGSDLRFCRFSSLAKVAPNQQDSRFTPRRSLVRSQYRPHQKTLAMQGFFSLSDPSRHTSCHYTRRELATDRAWKASPAHTAWWRNGTAHVRVGGWVHLPGRQVSTTGLEHVDAAPGTCRRGQSAVGGQEVGLQQLGERDVGGVVDHESGGPTCVAARVRQGRGPVRGWARPHALRR
jgi:hypothetical protein